MVAHQVCVGPFHCPQNRTSSFQQKLESGVGALPLHRTKQLWKGHDLFNRVFRFATQGTPIGAKNLSPLRCHPYPLMSGGALTPWFAIRLEN